MSLPLRRAFAALSLAACCAVFAGTPQLVRNINAQPIGEGSNPVFLGSLGGFSYFAADDGVHGNELWKTDGTAANTVLVSDIHPGAASSDPGRFVAVGNVAYFAATTATSGMELWSTDGTANGTHLVAELAAGNQPSDPHVAGAFGTDALVVANDTAGFKLWRTNGTPAGTTLLAGFGTQSFGARTALLVASNGKAYFSGFDPVLGAELWITDGSASGTHRLEDSLGNVVRSPTSFAQAGSFVYFIGTGDGGGGVSVWRIRLSDDELEQVTTGLDVGTGSFSSERLAVLGNIVVFVAGQQGSTTPTQVWRTDGTPAGTFALGGFDVMVGNTSVDPRFTVLGNRLFYATNANGTGIEFLTTDGTGVQTLIPPSGGIPKIFAVAGAHLYFAPSHGSPALYRTDGTPAGTVEIAPTPDFSPAWSNQILMAGDASIVYFSFNGLDGLSGAAGNFVGAYRPASNAWTELRRSVVQGAETFGATNGRLFFSPFNPTTGFEPWTSDGTVAGTRIAANVVPESTESGSNPTELVALGGRVYFAAFDGIAGRELWSSDGTANGTVLEADVLPGPLGSMPERLFVLGDSLIFYGRETVSSAKVLWRYHPASRTLEKLADAGPPLFNPFTVATANGVAYFPAFDGVWRTDGTVAGTRRLSDIAPVVAGIFEPRFFTEVGGRVYFISTQFGGTQQPGFPLWVTDGTESGTQRLVLFASTIAPAFLTKFDDKLWHMGALIGSPNLLWRTVPGTSFAVTGFEELRGFVGVVNQRLLFTAQAAPGDSVRLWTMEATASSFGKILNAAVNFAGPVSENGSLAFFTGSDANHGVGPWVTDGTEAGTRALVDVASNTTMDSQWVGDFHNVAIFTAVPSLQSPVRSFWRSDGTVAGTTAISELGAGRVVTGNAANLPPGVTAGNHFFFPVTDPVIGSELYALENDAPVAAADSASTNVGQAVTINVLGNDSDADGTIDASSVRIVNAPQNGTATVTSNGAITYTPAASFSGTASFTYSVRDRQARSSAPGTVSVSVAAPPPPPPPPGNSSGGGGGGGVLGWMTLLLLLGAHVSVARNSRMRK